MINGVTRHRDQHARRQRPHRPQRSRRDRDRGQGGERDRRRVRGAARAHQPARPSGVAGPGTHAMTTATSRKRPPIAPTRPAGGAQARAERTRRADHGRDRALRRRGRLRRRQRQAHRRARRRDLGRHPVPLRRPRRTAGGGRRAGFDELRARMATVDVPQGSSRKQVTALVDAAWAAFSTPTSRASLEILVATRARRDQRDQRAPRGDGRCSSPAWARISSVTDATSGTRPPSAISSGRPCAGSC